MKDVVKKIAIWRCCLITIFSIRYVTKERNNIKNEKQNYSNINNNNNTYTKHDNYNI